MLHIVVLAVLLSRHLPAIKYHYDLSPKSNNVFYQMYNVKILKKKICNHLEKNSWFFFFFTSKLVYYRKLIKLLPLTHSHILKIMCLLERVILRNADITQIQHSTIYIAFANHGVPCIGDNGKTYSLRPKAHKLEDHMTSLW